jgi:hypothetical protein
LNSPGQLLVALFELGPVLLIAPLVTLKIRSSLRSGKLVMAGLAIMAIPAFCLPLILRFVERDRDISRLTSSALEIWLVLGIPYLWLIYKRGKRPIRIAIGSGYALTVLGGIALLPTLLVTIARPQLTYFAGQSDALMSKLYWDRLAPGARILDPAYLYRPAMLFGRTTAAAYQDMYISLPAFQALVTRLDPLQIAAAGYDYIYFDRQTWQELTPEQRAAYQQPCIHLMRQVKEPDGDYRRLLDIQQCRSKSNSENSPN